jgi:hypothetical protein
VDEQTKPAEASNVEIPIIRWPRKAVIYVAGPYRTDGIFGRLQNILTAGQAAYRIWKSGHYALCPHFNTMLMCEDGRKTELQGTVEEHILCGDLEMMTRCDAVRVLDGWQKSKGTQREMLVARQHGIPLFFDDFKMASWLAEFGKAQETTNDERSPDGDTDGDGDEGAGSVGEEG